VAWPVSLRKPAHLTGDHGKAATLLAGARRFDGGVEGQQVVCSAISLMTEMTLPISLELRASPSICSLVARWPG